MVDMEKASNKVHSNPGDQLKKGVFHSVRSKVDAKHVVEKVQLGEGYGGTHDKLQSLADVYGSHVPLRLLFEENILRGFRRPGGFSNEFFGLEILSGKVEDLEWEDVLDRPEEREAELVREDLHTTMERWNGMGRDLAPC